MSDLKYVSVGTAAETTVTITRTSASSDRPQGLVCEADHPLTVGEAESTRLVLWADSAPETTTIVTSEAGDLRMWNVWREGDLIQAWEGTAHIELDDEGDDLGLTCFDARAGSDATLELRVSFDRAWTQPAPDNS